MIANSKSSVAVILVDAREASRLLAISSRTLWQLTKNRCIPSVRIGRSVRYRIADLDAWTRNQTEE
jgi:excisionase family DNA binding protein